MALKIENENICSICLEEFDGKEIYILNCNKFQHTFHLECIYNFIQEICKNYSRCLCRFSCPLCRNKLNLNIIKNIFIEYSENIYYKNYSYKLNLNKINIQINILKYKILFLNSIKYKKNYYTNLNKYLNLTNYKYNLENKMCNIYSIIYELNFSYNNLLFFERNNCYMCEF